jgi:hypothetical protein
MSAFDDFRRGFRTGLGRSSAEQPIGGGFDFGGDELAECKAVIAGLLEENTSLKAQQAQWVAAISERDNYIGELADERDRAFAQRGELETIIAFPGVKNALLKALHPDTGTGGDVVSRTAAFQRLMTIFERLGLGR